MRKDLKDLWSLTEPYVRDAGFDLIEVTFGREASGWVLRLFIDAPAGALVSAGASVPTEASTLAGASVPSSTGGGPLTVSHDDCARVSRDVSAALDVADSIPHAYQLEVSSPGLDRPLRREGDFARFVGESVRIKLSDEGGGVDSGRRNFSGKIRAAKDGRVEIECDGRSYLLPIDGIAKANLIPDWEREFHRSAS
jgi:ribosome maturation factor RimP